MAGCLPFHTIETEVLVKDTIICTFSVQPRGQNAPSPLPLVSSSDCERIASPPRSGSSTGYRLRTQIPRLSDAIHSSTYTVTIWFSPTLPAPAQAGRCTLTIRQTSAELFTLIAIDIISTDGWNAEQSHRAINHLQSFARQRIPMFLNAFESLGYDSTPARTMLETRIIPRLPGVIANCIRNLQTLPPEGDSVATALWPEACRVAEQLHLTLPSDYTPANAGFHAALTSETNQLLARILPTRSGRPPLTVEMLRSQEMRHFLQEAMLTAELDPLTLLAQSLVWGEQIAGPFGLAALGLSTSQPPFAFSSHIRSENDFIVFPPLTNRESPLHWQTSSNQAMCGGTSFNALILLPSQNALRRWGLPASLPRRAWTELLASVPVLPGEEPPLVTSLLRIDDSPQAKAEALVSLTDVADMPVENCEAFGLTTDDIHAAQALLRWMALNKQEATP